MIDISKTSWHYKLYRFFSQLCAAWRGNEDFYKYPKNQNMIGLCQYMRMILIWGPLVMLTYLIPIGAVTSFFFWLPFSLNGSAGVMSFYAVVASLIFVIVVATIAIWLIKRSTDAVIEYRETKKNKSKVETKTKKPNLLFEYAKAIKSKMCPILKVEEK